MKDIQKKAIELESKFRSYLDARDHPLARQLESEIRRLIDEAEQDKHPRAVEDRVKGIIRILDTVDDNDEVMDHHHSDDLRSRCERLREDLRKLQ